MNHPLRLLAGGFAGLGGLILLWQGETAAGVAILSSMVGFFVGDANGRRHAERAEASS